MARIKIRTPRAARKKKEHFCLKCNVPITNNRSAKCKLCVKESQLRANYPDANTLIEMIKSQGYVKVAKQLGVSDNAVRKHLKARGHKLP